MRKINSQFALINEHEFAFIFSIKSGAKDRQLTSNLQMKEKYWNLNRMSWVKYWNKLIEYTRK